MPNPVRRTCDKTVVTLMVLLLLMGLVTLFQRHLLSKAATGDALAAVKKQLIGVALGAAACVTLSRVPYRVFRRPKVTLLLLTAKRFDADSGDYSGNRREHQRLAAVAEYLRAEHAALGVCEIRDGRFSWPGRWIGAARRLTACLRGSFRCWPCRA